MNRLFVAFDGDNMGQKVGTAVLMDDAQTLNDVSKKIEAAGRAARQWVEARGGQMISQGGDEGTFVIDPAMEGRLEELRQLYQTASGGTVTLGTGLSLSQAGKALIAGKLMGKDIIVRYDQQTESVLADAHEQAQTGQGGEEAQKLDQHYLSHIEGDANPEQPSAEAIPQGEPNEQDQTNMAEMPQDPQAPAQEGEECDCEICQEGSKEGDAPAQEDGALPIQAPEAADQGSDEGDSQEDQDPEEKVAEIADQSDEEAPKEQKNPPSEEAPSAFADDGDDKEEEAEKEVDQDSQPEEKMLSIPDARGARADENMEPEEKVDAAAQEEGDEGVDSDEDADDEESDDHDSKDDALAVESMPSEDIPPAESPDMTAPGKQPAQEAMAPDAEAAAPDMEPAAPPSDLDVLSELLADAGSAEEIKARVADILQRFKANRDKILAMKEQAPEMYQNIIMMLKNMIDMAKQMAPTSPPEDDIASGEAEAPEVGALPPK